MFYLLQSLYLCVESVERDVGGNCWSVDRSTGRLYYFYSMFQCTESDARAKWWRQYHSFRRGLIRFDSIEFNSIYIYQYRFEVKETVCVYKQRNKQHGSNFQESKIEGRWLCTVCEREKCRDPLRLIVGFCADDEMDTSFCYLHAVLAVALPVSRNATARGTGSNIRLFSILFCCVTLAVTERRSFSRMIGVLFFLS